MNGKKQAIVTGGSSGIGAATAKALLDRGYEVYEFSRREAGTVSGVKHIQCDVTDEEQVDMAVFGVYDTAERIDIVINNAGFGISGAIEFTDSAADRKQMDVNFFGMVNMNHAVLPIMRKQKSGRIINISSVAAPIAIPFQAYYSASKAAIEAYSLALLNEVRPFGVKVVTILPGDIHTGFTSAREKSAEGDKEYEGRISRSVAVMEHDEETGMTPEKAGEKIVQYALKNNPAPEYVIGGEYKLFVFLKRLLPTRTLYNLVGRIYAK